MVVSRSALELKAMIEKAIDNHKLSRSEYDTIIHRATEDGHIDSQEKALLSQLQQMIDDKSIKVTPD